MMARPVVLVYICLCAGADGPKVDKRTAAYLTVRSLSRAVPPAVPGIVFLSGRLISRVGVSDPQHA